MYPIIFCLLILASSALLSMQQAPVVFPSPPVPTDSIKPSSANCDIASQQRISTCSHELSTLGIFSQTAGQIDQLTLNDLRRRSKEYFLQICNAYTRFNQCLGGGSYIKQACYQQEPIKARFAVADAALDYVCGEGYSDMLLGWDCYLSAATRSDVSLCETRIGQDASRQQPVNVAQNDYQGASACYALQNYIQCIRAPIEQTCGPASFDVVVQAIERPVHVYMPYCTLGASGTTPSAIVIMLLIATAICRRL